MSCGEGFLDDRTGKERVGEALASLLIMVTQPISRVARTDCRGIIVSTLYAPDTGRYETALLDAEDAYVVMRYETREQAVDGHLRWCEAVPNLEEVTTISQFGLPPRKIQLKRGERQ